MKRYDLLKGCAVVAYADRYGIKEGMTYAGELETLESFEDVEEAKKALYKHDTDLKWNGSKYIFTEFFIEENEVDEDGEIIETLGTVENSKMFYSVKEYDVMDFMKDRYDLLVDYDEIAIHNCRNGRRAAWYLSESKEVAIYIDDLEELTPEEIEKELM